MPLVCAASVFGQAADPRPTFTVGTAKASRGQKAMGVIAVPPGSDAGTNIPVVVVHGARPGRVLALVAGAHGTEYASIVALEKMIALLDPAQLAGTVIIVPLVNLASFEQKIAHINPVDGKSLNRFYPGNPNGTQTERTSYAITREVVEQCDHLIDLHGGDIDESLRPYSYWNVTGNQKQDQISREMALAFGLDTIIISADRPKDPAASRYLENTASTRGKPSLTAEAGHAGTVETDDVNALVSGCLSVMRYLQILPGIAVGHRAPGLDRTDRARHQRADRHVLPDGQARDVRGERDAGRLRDRLLRQDDLRSARARGGRGPLPPRRPVDDEGGDDCEHRGRQEGLGARSEGRGTILRSCELAIVRTRSCELGESRERLGPHFARA